MLPSVNVYVCSIWWLWYRNSDIKWLHITLHCSLTEVSLRTLTPNSPVLASKLRWPVYANLDTLFTFSVDIKALAFTLNTHRQAGWIVPTSFLQDTFLCTKKNSSMGRKTRRILLSCKYTPVLMYLWVVSEALTNLTNQPIKHSKPSKSHMSLRLLGTDKDNTHQNIGKNQRGMWMETQKGSAKKTPGLFPMSTGTIPYGLHLKVTSATSDAARCGDSCTEGKHRRQLEEKGLKCWPSLWEWTGWIGSGVRISERRHVKMFRR